MRAGIVDYRMGNLASLSKAVERAGWSAAVSEDPKSLGSSDVLLLPGVGNFAAGMANLDRSGLDSFVRDWAAEGKPLIGICLGMQLLFDQSEEGDRKGLGLLSGDVVLLPTKVKVPHMGWNDIRTGGGLFERFDGRRFYFVHSYYCVPNEASTVTATTEYGVSFAAAVTSGNIAGVQFHPEKSSDDGISLLKALMERAA